MKKTAKLFSLIIAVVLILTAIIPSAFAKEFAPKIDATNLGVQTQYAYSENNVSWIRKIAVKEDLLSVEGIATEATLHPVTNYPYTTDAAHFKSEVEESTKNYTLDEESQKAAYYYVLQQIGALTVFTEPTTSDQTKADWLRDNGIVITPEDEKDPDKILMISALYAMMRNDLYYVYTGNKYEIPAGTPLEDALIQYVIALSGQENSLTAFMVKFFGSTSIGSFEDYIYYTSLMALYTNGYVSIKEIPQISRGEVFRRVAIMTIRTYGLSIDAEKATTEELQQKYLTAMLGTQYKVSLDPSSLVNASNDKGIAYYILQRMAREDSNITISSKKHNFEQCFDIVLKRTKRFNLENEFYSDIYEYDVFLENNRSSININPTPLTGNATVQIDGKAVVAGQYAEVKLKNVALQTINVICSYTVNKKTTSSTYKFNIHQGVEPPKQSNITGIIPTYSIPTPEIEITGPTAAPIYSAVNQAGKNFLSNVLSLNDKGQLVDQNGNIIADGNYQTLPEGYKYVLGDDGIIQVVFASEEESTTTAQEKEKTEKIKDMRNIIIFVSLGLCLFFLIALIITVILMKKRSKKSKQEQMKARKDKEKAKKAKLQAKADKKKKKD